MPRFWKIEEKMFDWDFILKIKSNIKKISNNLYNSLGLK